MAKKITIADIAEYSGVSPATISRVMNHRDKVKEETVKLVEDAMLALGKPIIQNNKEIDDHSIIILNIPDIDNAYYQKIISGASVSAKAHNCDILVNESPLDKASLPAFLNLIKKIGASGVILLNHISVESLNKINSIVPIVQCSEYNDEANIPFVSINNYSAAKNATEHLISIGKNKIAFLNGPLSFKYAVERRRGFTDAMSEAGLSIPQNWLVQLPKIDHDMAYAAVTQILDSRIIPNAFFAVSDVLAAAVIRAVRKRNLRIPEDVAIVGFDNIELSVMTVPSLSTVSQPMSQLGYTASEMLFESINSQSSGSKSIFLNTELVVRESTTIKNINTQNIYRY